MFHCVGNFQLMLNTLNCMNKFNKKRKKLTKMEGLETKKEGNKLINQVACRNLNISIDIFFCILYTLMLTTNQS
jgi:hypothetical protein